MDYTRNYGKQIADKIKYEDEYRDEIENFNLWEFLFNNKNESR